MSAEDTPGTSSRIPPTRLFFDARYIRPGFHDGISRFSTELAHAVAALAPSRHVAVTFLVHKESPLQRLPRGASTLRIHGPTSWREPFTARLLNRHRPDVVFSPMQTIGSLGRRFRLILTLHDTIYYRHRTPPRDLPALVRLGWRLFHLSYLPQRLVLNRADIVATVSETSRRQFTEARLTKRPVLVVANAPQQLAELLPTPPDSAARQRKRCSTAPRNLIYMGSFMPYKNVETLVRGMAGLPDHTLHLLSHITAAQRRRLERLVPHGARVVFHNGVSDQEYAALLDDRAALVTLSLDEGYGLPLAEALAFGVPAVVSDLEIFREVAGDGALFVPATDAEAFARAVRALDDDEIREGLIRAGIDQLRPFSWQRSAAILLDAVGALASG